jgi:hypothetical protein
LGGNSGADITVKAVHKFTSSWGYSSRPIDRYKTVTIEDGDALVIVYPYAFNNMGLTVTSTTVLTP